MPFATNKLITTSEVHHTKKMHLIPILSHKSTVSPTFTNVKETDTDGRITYMGKKGSENAGKSQWHCYSLRRKSRLGAKLHRFGCALPRWRACVTGSADLSSSGSNEGSGRWYEEGRGSERREENSGGPSLWSNNTLQKWVHSEDSALGGHRCVTG